MTDRELLEMAAKAAGLRLFVWGARGKENFSLKLAGDVPGDRWNPLTDDGDALRMAVKLKFSVLIGHNVTRIEDLEGYDPVYHNDDPYAATRRAIVRAAAEIGKAMS